MTIVRTLIYIAASNNGCSSHQMDVKNAFLHGDLTKDICMISLQQCRSLYRKSVCASRNTLYIVLNKHIGNGMRNLVPLVFSTIDKLHV